MFRNIISLIKIVIVISILYTFYDIATEEKDLQNTWTSEVKWEIDERIWPKSRETGEWYVDVRNKYNYKIMVFYDVHYNEKVVPKISVIKSKETTGPLLTILEPGGDGAWIEIKKVLRYDF